MAFIEKEVDDFQDAVEAGREFVSGGDFERDALVADALAGADEAFGNGGFGDEEGVRDLGGAESAEGFQGEGGLRLGGQAGVAADEHEAELVVGDFPVISIGIFRAGDLDLGDDGGFLFEEIPFAAEMVDGEVFRGAQEPCAGIFRDAERPGFHGSDHRLLDDVLGELEVPRAVDAGEDRHHFRRLVAEEMVGEPVGGIFGGGAHAGRVAFMTNAGRVQGHRGV